MYFRWARHTRRFTRHTSRVTRHASHVTRHASRVTHVHGTHVHGTCLTYDVRSALMKVDLHSRLPNPQKTWHLAGSKPAQDKCIPPVDFDSPACFQDGDGNTATFHFPTGVALTKGTWREEAEAQTFREGRKREYLWLGPGDKSGTTPVLRPLMQLDTGGKAGSPGMAIVADTSNHVIRYALSDGFHGAWGCCHPRYRCRHGGFAGGSQGG